jgi:hypothetical protein
MGKVKRFGLRMMKDRGLGILPLDDGEFVNFTDYAALEVRLQKTREALERYGKHSPNCEYLQNVVMLDRSTIIRGECTCGLADALAEFPLQPKEDNKCSG